MAGPFPKLTMGFPGGTTAGDHLVIIVYADQLITPPINWTDIVHTPIGGDSSGIFYSSSFHTVTATEITAGTTWDWMFGGPGALHLGYDIFDFANVTGLNDKLVTPFTTPVGSMDAPSVTSSNNALCFAFWIVLGETPIRIPFIATGQFEDFSPGGISHLVVGFTASGATTGIITAIVDMPNTGIAAMASLTGAGSHLVATSSGSVG